MTGRTARRRLLPAVLAGLLWSAAGVAQDRTVRYYNPDWSPDGRTIVFESDREGELALYLVAADGGAVTRLTPPGLEAEVPRFSPEGDWITFVSREGDGPLQLYRVRRDGSDLDRIAASDRADYSASWSPDGTRLVFMSRPAGATVTHDLHVVTLDGRERGSITGADGNDLSPDWSPSGEWIAFIRGTAFHKSWPDLTEAEREEMQRSRDVWIVRPDGSELTRITADDVPDCCPHWSPYGDEVLYRHGRDADAVVLALRPGGKPRRVAGLEVADPNPSPDGTRFVYTRQRDGEWGVFVYEREPGAERRIVP